MILNKPLNICADSIKLMMRHVPIFVALCKMRGDVYIAGFIYHAGKLHSLNIV